jgi:hypothetical protein
MVLFEAEGDMKNPLKYFSEVSDPRVERNREHHLDEISVVAIAAVLSGAESWNEIAEFGEEKKPWLQTFLKLLGGTPSHDSFNRVFAALDPDELAWAWSLADLTAGGVVAIDGKTLRARGGQEVAGAYGYGLVGARAAQGG